MQDCFAVDLGCNSTAVIQRCLQIWRLWPLLVLLLFWAEAMPLSSMLLPTTIPYFNHLCISSSYIFFTFVFSPLRPHALPDFTFSPPLNPFVPPSLRPLFFSLCHSILRPSVSRLPQHTTATPPHQKNVYSLTQSQNRYLTAGTLRGQRFKCSSSLSWQWR